MVAESIEVRVTDVAEIERVAKDLAEAWVAAAGGKRTWDMQTSGQKKFWRSMALNMIGRGYGGITGKVPL